MTVSATTPVAVLVVVYIVFGIGFGFVNPPISNTAVSGMPPAQAGVAASIASTCRQVGATLGVAVIGLLAAGRAVAGFVTASHGGWAVVCGCGLAVLLLGVASTSGWARATAKRTQLGEAADRRPGGRECLPWPRLCRRQLTVRLRPGRSRPRRS